MHKLRTFIFRYFFFCTLCLSAQVPDYYSRLDFRDSNKPLIDQLSNLIIDTHLMFIPYTSPETDTWDILRISDLDSEISDEVLLMYGYNDDDDESITDRTRYSYDTCHTWDCIGLWNREHVFARSLANPRLNTIDKGAGTDLHNIRAVDAQKNTQKSNRFFADGFGDSKIVNGSYFYPGDEWKGDVARILMYMHLRYPGRCDARDVAVVDLNDPNNTMPNILLEWNAQDPVSDFEIRRNDIIYTFQGNRNPFVDNPYLATLIWSGPEAEDKWGEFSSKRFYEKLEAYPTICSDEIFINNPSSEEFISFSILDTDGDIIQRGKAIHSILLKIDNPGPYVLKLGDSDKKEIIIYVQ